MLKVDRRNLEKRLYVVIEDNALNTKFKDKVKKQLEKHNITQGEVAAYFMKQIPLEVLDENVLCLLTMIFYQETQERILEPNRYFSDYEIAIAKDWQKPDEPKIDGDLKIPNVLRVADDQYITIINVQDVAKLFKNGRVFYNPNTQRGMIASKVGKEIISRIDINMSNVNEMAEKMASGDYIPNTLTFNVLKNGKDLLYYDERHMQVIIGEESEVDIVDGFHRSYAILKALILNPSLSFNMELRIGNWDVSRAKQFISQEDLRNPLKKLDKIALDMSDFKNQIVQQLNEQPQNELKSNIATDMSLIRYNRAYVTNAIMSEAISDNFEIKSQRDANKITRFLKDFFNELIGIYIDDFSDLEKAKERTALVHPNMFYGYVALASELMNYKNDWQDRLENILDEIDFSLTNPEWTQLKITENVLYKNEIEKIYNYYKGKVV
jgi:hypothetical protein